ncbi:MAG: ABC transporter ATP-binding protein [Thermodesulfobacteriota bacterium]|nr:ABC transporter ATP-binding protein [Thermodesulfobacteriota bacterium]
MKNKIIEIKELTHIYSGADCGIYNINLLISKGEFIILAGKNGSGKTTLFRHFNALLSPTSGKVSVHGKNADTHRILARKTTGMVFQDADTQIVGETVYDDTAFGPENLKLTRDEINRRVTSVLKNLGLLHLKERNPATLSGGEKRRLAIAGILSMNPEIIVLDEPFSNLDYPGTLDLLSCIKSLHKSGHTIIIATHELEKVISLATRMIIMDKGRIAHDDKPGKLIKTVEKFGIKAPNFGIKAPNILK